MKNTYPSKDHIEHYKEKDGTEVWEATNIRVFLEKTETDRYKVDINYNETTGKDMWWGRGFDKKVDALKFVKKAIKNPDTTQNYLQSVGYFP